MTKPVVPTTPLKLKEATEEVILSLENVNEFCVKQTTVKVLFKYQQEDKKEEGQDIMEQDLDKTR